MCGIAGIAGPGASRHREAVLRMVEAQRHRGPDGEGIYSFPSGQCVFGHRRLSILDLSPAAAQPMLAEGGQWGIIYNGECYNFTALRAGLEARGEVFSSTGDTEVVLRLLAREGVDSLPRLNAMFALALWDETERRLFLARDRFGQKPLYYAHVGGLVVFASEVRALLASGLIERRADEEGIVGFLGAGAVQGPNTIVRGISLLPRASCLIWKDGGERMVTYWRPEAGKRPCSAPELREVFTTAISRHLISDVPIGLFLSGGIDSSAAVAAAVHSSKGRVKTLSVVFPEQAEMSEAAHARRIAEGAGTEHYEVPITGSQMLESLARPLDAMDQPTIDSINTYVVSDAARRSGLKVAISGLGGDELFGGYRTFTDVARMVRLHPLLALLRGTAALLAIYPGLFATRGGKLADTFESPGDLLSAYQVRRRLFSSRQIKALAPGLARAGWISGISAARAEEMEEMIRGREIHDAIGLLEMDVYMGQTLLRDSDVMGMAVGLEIRLPFLDAEFADAALALEPEARRRGPLSKHRFVEAMGDWLPPENTRRAKQGFQLPFNAWLHNELRAEVDDGISHLAGMGGPFDGAAVRGVFKRFISRPGSISWSRPWALFILGRYLAANGISM